MIHLRRPRAEVALDTRTRSYLDRKSSDARKFTPRDVRVGKAWAAFLGTQARDKVAEALDAYTKAKCAYCEQIAAKDIEHFWPKTLYPARMFSGRISSAAARTATTRSETASRSTIEGKICCWIRA